LRTAFDSALQALHRLRKSAFPLTGPRLVSIAHHSIHSVEHWGSLQACYHLYLRQTTEAVFSLGQTGPPDITLPGSVPQMRPTLAPSTPAPGLRLVFPTGIQLNLLSRTFSSQFLHQTTGPSHFYTVETLRRAAGRHVSPVYTYFSPSLVRSPA